jgi:outer membrane protein OmpA-like peptidoglycan-associated protein
MRYLFLLSFYLIGQFGQPAQPAPTNAIRLLGICYDVTTAAYLPVDIYAMSGTSRTRLGQSDKDGKFSVLLPLSATSISFTSPTYRTATLPVTFVNNPTPMTDFGVGIIMGKQDSAVVQQADRLSVRNDFPTDIDVNYRVEPTDRRVAMTMTISAHGNHVLPGMHTVFRKGELMRFLHFEGAKPGSYRAFVSTTDGRVLIDKTFTLTKGLTFLEVRADVPNKPAPGKPDGATRTETAAPGTAIVYFEQSRYELTPETKSALDSAARLMTSQPQLLAHVTGYTDNMGEQKLNLTLSEYRAKLVAGYLKKQGVSDARLRVDWQGGNALVSPGDAEADKARNRRVVIQFSR